ncbi:MAG: hypothetical protein RLZZ628_3679 [Bacteroidota bacterium]|jgi:hypothetical protein
MTNTKLEPKSLLEIVWWVTTTVIVAGVMFPIWKDFPQFPFQITNILFVIAFVTFTRYAFLLKHTFLIDKQRLKIGFVALTGLTVLYFVNYINDFSQYIDQNDVLKIMKNVDAEKRDNLMSYIKNEMLFFGIGSIIAAIVLAGRLAVSVWRWHNYKKA